MIKTLKDPLFAKAFVSILPLTGLAALVLLLQTLSVVIFPLPIRFLIDHGLAPLNQGGNQLSLWGFSLSFQQAFLFVTLSLIVMSLFRMALDLAEEWSIGRSAAGFVECIRQDFFSWLLNARLSFFKSFNNADILGRISGDTANMEIFISSLISLSIRALPTLVIVCAIMFWVQWPLALCLLVGFPLVFYFVFRLSLKLKSTNKYLRRQINQYDEDLLQGIKAMPLIKSLKMQDEIKRGWKDRTRIISQSLVAVRKSQGQLNASMNSFKNFLVTAVVGLGGWAVIEGQMSLGDLVLFLAYTESLAKPLSEISKFSGKWSKAQASWDRLKTLEHQLKTNQESVSVNHSIDKRDKTSECLVLDQLGFHYPNSPELFKDWSCNFQLGQLIALVGPSGAGKSSFVQLLNRLQDPTNGEIRLQGINIQNIPLDQLRESVVLISQENYFLSGDIQSNLTLGLERFNKKSLKGATDLSNKGPTKSPMNPAKTPTLNLVELEELKTSLQKVNFEDVYKDPSLGFDTPLTNYGAPLSGGEQRRLNLARGFLRTKAKVVIFDEPTSGLDPFSSRAVANSLADLAKQGALVFWVTHDLIELEKCDRVLFFSKQKNPKCGGHLNLIAEHSSYRRFVEGGSAHA